MTVKSYAALTTEIGSTLPDNTTGSITPSAVRSLLQDMLDSLTQGAIVDSGTSNPTGNATTSFLMMGLGGAATITPQTTGRLLVIAAGGLNSPTAASGGFSCFLEINRGTGTAPSNGAAVTGTVISAVEQYTITAQTNVQAFSIQAVVTGLSLGVAIWLDLALKGPGSAITTQLLNAKITAIEF